MWAMHGNRTECKATERLICCTPSTHIYDSLSTLAHLSLNTEGAADESAFDISAVGSNTGPLGPRTGRQSEEAEAARAEAQQQTEAANVLRMEVQSYQDEVRGLRRRLQKTSDADAATRRASQEEDAGGGGGAAGPRSAEEASATSSPTQFEGLSASTLRGLSEESAAKLRSMVQSLQTETSRHFGLPSSTPAAGGGGGSSLAERSRKVSGGPSSPMASRHESSSK